MRLLALPATLLVLAALPAPAATAGSWTVPRDATGAGDAAPAGIASDARGRLAIGFFRRIGDRQRAEVRRGTMRGGLRGPSLVLDGSRSAVGGPVLAFSGTTGLLAAAWTRFDEGAHGLRAATWAPGRRTGARRLSDARESAYLPAFVEDPRDGDPLLAWSRRTSAHAAPAAGGAFAPAQTLPSGGVGSRPVVTVDRDGTLVVAWLEGGRLMVAQRPSGGGFGPAIAVSPGDGHAREPRAATTSGGDVVLVWLHNRGDGNAVLGAVRPAAGQAFGAPVEIGPASEHAREPALATTSAGETLVAWLATARGAGWGTAPGTVRLRRLTPAGTPAGDTRTLSGDGRRRTLGVTLAHDGAGSAFVAWTTTGPGRDDVYARRLAPGGLVGGLRRLSRGDADGPPPLLTGRAGLAVAAWQGGGDVRYARYR